MSKSNDLKLAHIEEEQAKWQCATCIAPAQENSQYCMSCEDYWNTQWDKFDEFLEVEMKPLVKTLEETYGLINEMAKFIDDNMGNPFDVKIIEVLNALDDEMAIAQGLIRRDELTKFNKEKGWK